jgi:hydroxymethylpyrimidine/phosphomethylpyrimidine kinase
MTRPIALTIAGSDSSGGAGIQADLKTFTVLGVYGASVITALTAQNTRGVQGVHGVPAAFITQQFDSVLSDLKVDAAKTGMLADRATVEAVAAALARAKLPALVVDPVMVATSGDVLLAPDAIEAVRSLLIPLADVVTPNLPEAAKLLDEDLAKSELEMAEQGRRLLALGARAALVKGGHGESAEAIDILVTANGVERLSGPRIETRNTHGTGCTLSAAIAAFMAGGTPLVEAARHAKQLISRAIAAGRDLEVGHGAGPVDHLVDFAAKAAGK